MPAVKNKWSTDCARNWFYCKVPSYKSDVHGKGTYPLRSEMTQLDYLTDAPYRCGADDINVMAFTEVAVITGGRETVEEFLACDIWLLSEGWEFEVETKESPLSRVRVPMPKVNLIGLPQQ
jgi:hypothetical protein